MNHPYEWLRWKFWRLQERWHSKNPGEKWCTIHDIGRIMCESIGIRVFSDMKNYWYTASCGVCALIYFLLNFYTIHYYLRRNQFTEAIECAYLICAVVGFIIMYYEAVGPHRFKFHSLGGFCGFHFYQTEAQSAQYKMLRVKFIDRFLLSLFIVLPLTAIGYAIIFTTPIYAHFFQDNRVTPLAIHLPFFEEDSDMEYTVNMVLQTVMAFYALNGALAIEFASCMINHAITVVPDLIQYNLNEFQDEFCANGINLKSIALLRNCFAEAQDFNRYVLDVIEIYYNKLRICPITWSFSIILSLFAGLVLKNIGGFGCAVGCYVHIIVLCYMGNNVKETRKQILVQLYDMPWYQLPASLQRQVQCTIHSVQNGAVLGTSKTNEFDYEMASNLSKFIYRITMLLVTSSPNLN